MQIFCELHSACRGVFTHQPECPAGLSWRVLSEAIAMFVNNGAWVLFWVFFFTRFPVLRGWSFKDVVSLWAISAAGCIAYCVMGNAHRHWLRR